MPRLRDDAEIAAGLGDDALRCGPAISGLTWSTATQAVTSAIHNCRMRLLRCTECGARNADFVVTGYGDETQHRSFSGRQIPVAVGSSDER